MAIPTVWTEGHDFLTTTITDISTASSAFIAIPTRCKLVYVYTVLGGTIDTADSVITAEINGTAVTGLSITVAYSSSAAGDRDSGEPTGANDMNAGDALEFITSGASGQTIPLGITAVVKRY